jgi:hypothetical protein
VNVQAKSENLRVLDKIFVYGYVICWSYISSSTKHFSSCFTLTWRHRRIVYWTNRMFLTFSSRAIPLLWTRPLIRWVDLSYRPYMCYGTAMLIHNPDSGLQTALVIQTFYVLLYSISSTSSDAMLIRQNLSCCLERKDSIGMLLDHFVLCCLLVRWNIHKIH